MADTKPEETPEVAAAEKKEEDSDEMPELVEDAGQKTEGDEHAGHDHAGHDHSHPEQARGPKKESRAEKKNKKALLKLGMKPFPGVRRVTIKKADNVLFSIEQADVYKSGESTYLVFGEAKIDDLSQNALQQAAAGAAFGGDAEEGDDDDVPDLVEETGATIEPVEEDEEDVDTSGIEDNDIQLVVGQTGVSKAEAVRAIRANDGDIVNAIMSLS